MKCPVCKADSDLVKKDEKYDLYACNECGLEFYYPLLPDPDFYTNYNENTTRFFNKDPFKHHELAIDYIAENLPCHKEGDRIVSEPQTILDVGCANGVFLKAVKDKFKNVMAYGIDLDKKSIEYAKNELRLNNVYNTSLEDFVKDTSYNKRFDIITAFDVLEHQTDPVGFLKNIDYLLKDNGTLIISVPNKNRVMNESNITKEDFPPHHYLLFDRISLYLTLSEIFPNSNIKIEGFWREPLMVLSLYDTKGVRNKILKLLDKFENYVKKDRCPEVWFELLYQCKEFSFLEKILLNTSSFLKQLLVTPEIFLYTTDIDKKSALFCTLKKNTPQKSSINLI
jgi:SAM-dependent methyltransferase